MGLSNLNRNNEHSGVNGSNNEGGYYDYDEFSPNFMWDKIFIKDYIKLLEKQLDLIPLDLDGWSESNLVDYAEKLGYLINQINLD